ncbi:hypothetical protein BF638R_0050 [Bacteroides fragilis 638R]|uniref:Uncharacterized protein n=1 Tax=Bacteroides fragilis (strain 638R) TaxID=862962 RepID=E1WJU2_BACF6|nr:hypothetical protein BF638R_0050 [Bacteroides fragilis 638R]
MPLLLNLLKEMPIRHFLFVILHQIRVECVLTFRGTLKYADKTNE